MSARNGRFGSFASGTTKGKAAGAIAACTVMLLAGCGGSGGSAASASSADASAPVIRGMGGKEVRTVSFNANGGTGTMAVQSASTATALTANAFTRTGYTFAGWAATSTGVVAYVDRASYPFSVNATLYAKWLAAS